MWGFRSLFVLVAAASGLVAALPTSLNTTVSIVLKRSITGATGADCNGTPIRTLILTPGWF
jgi:hypothetical protein